MNRDSSDRCVRLRDRFREETAEAILAAAERVFADEGLRGARVESIAAAAGVAVGTVYNHFKDREALLQELSRSRREALIDKLDAALAAGEGQPFPEALRRFLDALFGHWATHERFLTLLVQSEGSFKQVSPKGSKARTTRQEILARIEKLIRRGQASGALRPETAEIQPAALVGMVWGLLMQAIDQQRLDRVQEQLDQAVDLFQRGAGR